MISLLLKSLYSRIKESEKKYLMVILCRGLNMLSEAFGSATIRQTLKEGLRRELTASYNPVKEKPPPDRKRAKG